MIPLLYYILGKYIAIESKLIIVRAWEMIEYRVNPNRYGISFRGDRKVLKLDSDNDLHVNVL